MLHARPLATCFVLQSPCWPSVLTLVSFPRMASRISSAPRCLAEAGDHSVSTGPIAHPFRPLLGWRTWNAPHSRPSALTAANAIPVHLLMCLSSVLSSCIPRVFGKPHPLAEDLCGGGSPLRSQVQCPSISLCCPWYPARRLGEQSV